MRIPRFVNHITSVQIHAKTHKIFLSALRKVQICARLFVRARFAFAAWKFCRCDHWSPADVQCTPLREGVERANSRRRRVPCAKHKFFFTSRQMYAIIYLIQASGVRKAVTNEIYDTDTPHGICFTSLRS